MDKYQSRYLKHQDKKKRTLVKLMKDRHSTRIFSDKQVSNENLQKIVDAVKLCPSSCNRKAVGVEFQVERDDKQLLGGLLVGGVGWIHRAPVIALIWADKIAYKENLDNMPYLDMGVVIQQIYLMCEAIGLKCCYVNPNVRHKHLQIFKSVYGDRRVFGGAFAIGYS